MIRYICLHYDYNNQKIVRVINHFFKFVGCYIIDKVFYKEDSTINTKINELIKQLSEKYSISNKNEMNFEMNIYLLSTFPEEKYIKNIDDKIPKIIIGLNKYKTSILNNVEYYNKDNEPENIIYYIINSLHKLKLISDNELSDLNFLCDFYFKNNIYDLFYNTEFLYPIILKNYEELIKQYEDTTDKLTGLVSNITTNWKDKEHIILYQSIIYLSVNANLYSLYAKKYIIYDYKSLFNHCQLFKNDNNYNNSFSILTGVIYNYFLGEEKEAYYTYEKLYNSEFFYNTYVRFLRGDYWYYYGCDYYRAIQNYIKSILLDSNNYRAWWKLGLSLTYNKDSTNAVKVLNLFIELIKNSSLDLPIYYRYLFNSYLKIGDNYQINNNFNESLEYYRKAEIIYNCLKDNDYLLEIKNELNISHIYKELSLCYYKCGNKEYTGRYLTLFEKTSSIK